MHVKKKVIDAVVSRNAVLWLRQHGRFKEQIQNIITTWDQLVDRLRSERYKIIVTCGNEPQIG